MTFSFQFNAETGLLNIDDGSTEIPAAAFDSRKDITSVYIPDSVISIGDLAFNECSLKEVVIGKSVTTIGNYAFIFNQLTEVVIPDSVTSIGNGAFYYNSLVNITVPNTITTIGEFAFTGNKLTEVVIPNSVTSIGRGAFLFNNLTEVILPAHFEDNPPDQIFDSGVNVTFRDGLMPEPEPIDYELPTTNNNIKGNNKNNNLKGTKSLISSKARMETIH